MSESSGPENLKGAFLRSLCKATRPRPRDVSLAHVRVCPHPTLTNRLRLEATDGRILARVDLAYGGTPTKGGYLNPDLLKKIGTDDGVTYDDEGITVTSAKKGVTHRIEFEQKIGVEYGAKELCRTFTWPDTDRIIPPPEYPFQASTWRFATDVLPKAVEIMAELTEVLIAPGSQGEAPTFVVSAGESCSEPFKLHAVGNLFELTVLVMPVEPELCGRCGHLATHDAAMAFSRDRTHAVAHDPSDYRCPPCHEIERDACLRRAIEQGLLTPEVLSKKVPLRQCALCLSVAGSIEVLTLDGRSVPGLCKHHDRYCKSYPDADMLKVKPKPPVGPEPRTDLPPGVDGNGNLRPLPGCCGHVHPDGVNAGICDLRPRHTGTHAGRSLDGQATVWAADGPKVSTVGSNGCDFTSLAAALDSIPNNPDDVWMTPEEFAKQGAPR